VAAIHGTMAPMELRDLSIEDLPLYERMLTDPGMMAELGGPLPRDGLWAKFQEVVASVQDGSVWYFKIVPDEGTGEAAGTVCVWEHEWMGARINEIGWMVLPVYQGRGLASQAVRAVLERARSEGRWDVIHAFPAISNAASNAICRKTGFIHLEECDFEYAGRILRCNNWQVDLRAPRA
jgi:RimJ/RimL family protein N-acetyltransferase